MARTLGAVSQMSGGQRDRYDRADEVGQFAPGDRCIRRYCSAGSDNSSWVLAKGYVQLTHSTSPILFSLLPLLCTDSGLLTVAQFAWMEHDYFLPSLRPLFLSYGLSEFRVKILIEDAQRDLYYPVIQPHSCVHVSHARKLAGWIAPRRRSRRLR